MLPLFLWQTLRTPPEHVARDPFIAGFSLASPLSMVYGRPLGHTGGVLTVGRSRTPLLRWAVVPSAKFRTPLDFGAVGEAPGTKSR